MNKILLLSACATLIICNSYAQPWAPTGKAQKLEDIIQQHEPADKEEQGQRDKESNRNQEPEENESYLFDRWVAYWKRHLDENGYMVSSAKNFQAAREQQQKRALSKTTSNMSQWTFAGPTTTPGGYAGIGRISSISFHPTDVNTYIIGSAGGGAWRTTTDGLSWTPLYENLAVLGVSDVDYNPQNPNTIYLCTGDRDGGDTYSVGLMKSTDGGATWNTTGLVYSPSDFTLLNTLIINPHDTNSLTVATSNGVLRSFDGGATWNTVLGAGQHFKQVLYHPVDTNVIFATSYGGGDANIYRTTDAGMNWQTVTSFSDASRICLATCSAAPSMVKALVANLDNGLQGVYQSGDDGSSFAKIFGDQSDCTTNILSGSLTPNSGDCSGQGWYDLSIVMSPTNPDEVVVGGVNTWHSTDGGNSFYLATQWYSGMPGVKTVHADKHFHAYNPLNTSILYECNDGGIYKTSNPYSLLWTDISNGLGITQFYRNSVSDITDFVIGGAQDNGSKSVSFSGVYEELTGGDGMDCQLDYSDPTVFYTSSQFGSFNRTTNGGLSFEDITGNIPGNPQGEWITPLIISPSDPYSILAGFEHVWWSNDRGDSWTDISPSMASNSQMQRLTMTPADPNRIFGLWNNNTIRYTPDFGNTWTVISHNFSNQISDILADPKDPDVLWATLSGYGGARVARHKTGGSWVSQSSQLPDVPVNCIIKDSSNGTLYVGTDIGVFFRDTSTTQWSAYDNGLATAEVMDLGINYATNEIWAATFGRGLWKSPRNRDTTSSPNSVALTPFAIDVISVIPNPNNGAFAVTTNNAALKSAEAEVLVTGYDGKKVARQTGRFDASGRLEVNLGQVARGLYVLEVKKNGITFAKTKMVIQ